MRDWGLALRSIDNEIVLIMEHTINLFGLLLIPLLNYLPWAACAGSCWAGNVLRWWLVSSKVSWLGKKMCHCKGPCGVLRRSANNRTIWPTISSSRCDSLKLCSNSFDHQSKLAFIWSSPLISTSFLSLSALGDLLFSSPRPFDLGLWALVFTAQKGPHTERERKVLILLCCLHFCYFFLIYFLLTPVL